jgi:hypothetical protein
MLHHGAPELFVILFRRSAFLSFLQSFFHSSFLSFRTARTCPLFRGNSTLARFEARLINTQLPFRAPTTPSPGLFNSLEEIPIVPLKSESRNSPRSPNYLFEMLPQEQSRSRGRRRPIHSAPPIPFPVPTKESNITE